MGFHDNLTGQWAPLGHFQQYINLANRVIGQ